jgi:catechol 2,3-dioxygenase-like lactoylglutathione lyase family enzyme
MGIKRLQNIYYVVSDTARSRSFYQDVLGLHLKFDDPGRWVQFGVGDAAVALGSPAEAPVGASGGIVVFEVDSLEEMRARIEPAGARIIAERDMGAHGRTLAFEDPDGNIMQLYQRAASA